jgi:hypothetical protein
VVGRAKAVKPARMNFQKKRWLPCYLPAHPRLPLILRRNRVLDWASAGDAGCEAMLLPRPASTIRVLAQVRLALRPGGTVR